MAASVPRWYRRFVPDFEEPGLSELSEGRAETESLTDHFNEREPPLKLPTPGLYNASLIGRELGLRKASSTIRSSAKRALRSYRAWTGASKDVLSVAWSADDSHFAVGASADFLDRTGIPYNRNNNLLFGDVYHNQLIELPDHQISRSDQLRSLPRLDTESEPTLTSASTSDPGLFTSVSTVSFAPHHSTLYTAGYDRTVRVWDVPQGECDSARPKSLITLQHDAFVDLAIQMPTQSADEPKVLTTAQQNRSNPIQLFGLPADKDFDYTAGFADVSSPLTTFFSTRAQSLNITPSALQYGPDHSTRRYLLAGFAEHNSSEALVNREGHVAIWDVNRPGEPFCHLRSANENVFDVAWQPDRFVVAAATTPRNSLNLTHRRDTKSVIRTWSPTESLGCRYELECPARDVNDLQFHSSRELLVASCTDGRIYIWDYRRADRLLATLEHGQPIETFAAGEREERDVSVRFTTWAENGRFLYTGGSDGRLACWDILAVGEYEEASVQEVAKFDAGIMAGTFTKDESKLLLGLVKGSIEVLTIGACSASEANEDKQMGVSNAERAGTFTYVPADSSVVVQETDDDTVGTDAARELLTSEQLVLDPRYGVGQGPKYQGPWSLADRPQGCTDPRATPLLPDVAAQQFDMTTRRAGRDRGGHAPNAFKTRSLAKECQKNVVRRHKASGQDVNSTSIKSQNTMNEDRVRGPDTLEFESLAELERFASISDESVQQRPQSPRSSEPPNNPPVRTQPPALVKQEALTPAKRRADDTLIHADRKRSQTPKASLGRELLTIASKPTAARTVSSRSPAHRSGSIAHRPASQEPPRRLGTDAANGQPSPRASAAASQPVIIDLCDSDDEDESSVINSNSPVNEGPLQGHQLPSQQLQISDQDQPLPGIDTDGFLQPNTPRRDASHSPAANGTPQHGDTPHTPSQRLSKTHFKSPSSQRSGVIPASPGKHGFIIPPRFLSPDP